MNTLNHGVQSYLQPIAAYDPRCLGYIDFPTQEPDRPETGTLIEQVFAYYQEALWATPRALGYLEHHSITDRAVIHEAEVGFVDRTLGKQLPNGKTLDGALIRGQLQRLGLFLSTGGEFFRGALVFPCRNDRGKLIGAYGQRITPALRLGTPYQLYWALQPVQSFPRKALDSQQHFILCQHPLDQLILRSVGFSNVVTTLGANSFSDRHIRQFVAAGTQSVCLAFENTRDGNHLAGLVAQVLDESGISCLRPALPAGKGIADFITHYGKDALILAIQRAKPWRQTYEGLREVWLC